MFCTMVQNTSFPERLIAMKRKMFFVLLFFTFIFSGAVLTQSATGSCAPKKVKLNVKKLTLSKGSSYTLRTYNMKKKQTVRFVSDNEAVVSVSPQKPRSKNAEINAIGTGSTVVRANIYSAKGRLMRTLKTKIQVTPLAISIKFTHRKVKLNVDDTMKLSVIIKPSTSQEIPLYETTDPDVVTVNSKGMITAVAPGEAVIKATLISSSQKVECRVIVLDEDPVTPAPVQNNSSDRKH